MSSDTVETQAKNLIRRWWIKLYWRMVPDDWVGNSEWSKWRYS